MNIEMKKVGIVLVSESVSYEAGDTINITATTDVGDIKVVATQLSVKFDPGILEFVSATKGDLFVNGREIGW